VNHYFVNVKNNKVLEVQGGKDEEGHNVGVNVRNNRAYQRWRVVYADTVKNFKKNGLNRDLGFHKKRPIYNV
jgi:hypothetical protein